jgi:pyridoxamine 5'-phosphate oxidase
VDRTDVDPDPLRQIQAWLHAARAADEALPQRMTLATATPDGVPSARMVILRDVDTGLVFCTDRESDKGVEMAANPRAAAVLHWLRPTQRQVRVTGLVSEVDRETSERYWQAYAPEARLAQAASRQGEVIADRAQVAARAAKLREEYPGGEDLPRPPRWVGLRLVPDTVELWEEAPDRLHDRLRYRRDGNGWVIDRLSP